MTEFKINRIDNDHIKIELSGKDKDVKQLFTWVIGSYVESMGIPEEHLFHKGFKDFAKKVLKEYIERDESI